MNVIRVPETNVRQVFKKESLLFSPRKILLIGKLGSGKTMLAEYLARDTGFPTHR